MIKYYYKYEWKKKYDIYNKSILSKNNLEYFIVNRILESVGNNKNTLVITGAVMEVYKKVCAISRY